MDAKAGMDLVTQTQHWPTPRASDGAKGGPNMRGTRGDTPLPSMAAMWPTPSARDHKSEEASEQTLSRNARPLNEIARQWPTPSANEEKYRLQGKTQQSIGLEATSRKFSRPVPVISTDGIELSPTVNSITERRRLNPEFAEWLMGWPIGWTSTEPIACAASAMASWRFKLRQHLLNLYAGAI